jgi:hypothetical protein
MLGLGKFSPEAVAEASRALADEEVLCIRAEQVLEATVVWPAYASLFGIYPPLLVQPNL